MHRGLDDEVAALMARARAEGRIDSWSRTETTITVCSGSIRYRLALNAAATFLRDLLRLPDAPPPRTSS